MNGFRSTYGAGPDAITLSFAGPYGTSVPGPTTGTAMSLRAGVLHGIVTTTAFSALNTGIAVEAYIDGNLVATMRLNPGHPVSEHAHLSTAVFSWAIAAGTHYLGLRTIAGTTNTDDFGSFFGIVTAT